MEIIYLEEVEFDLQDGRELYDKQQLGTGDYFVDSLLADVESLTLYGGQPFRTFRILSPTRKDLPFRDILPSQRQTDFCLCDT